jgi:site-specific DNA recombinase
VRLIFDLYLARGSLLALLRELRKRGVKTRVRPLATGRVMGGVFFTRGPLAYLLANRMYVGDINHHDRSYPGEHVAIVDREVFDKVQALLARNGRDREPTRHGSRALLKDLLFDGRGFRMTPSTANKGGLRYRYYVSRALIEGAADRAGSVARVSAPAIEAAVMKALAPLMEKAMSDGFASLPQRATADGVAPPMAGESAEGIEPQVVRTSADGIASGAIDESLERETLLAMVERVIVSRRRLTSVFSAEARDRLDLEKLDVAWTPTASKPRREVLALNDPSARPMENDTRVTLIDAIARGRTWLDELGAGKTDIEAIAAREKRSTRGIQKTISLAFLSPRIVQGAIDGVLPRGLSMTRLFDLPMDWNQQHRMLGID